VDKAQYDAIEAFMLEQMKDSAHDKYHVYRVLASALDIYKHESGACYDVLVAACLLHDIGRKAQFADLENVCHAEVGGEMAYDFLLKLGWAAAKAIHVKNCIQTHRYRQNNPPKSIEAKILFDADKLDACGAVGIARTLIYQGIIDAPMYILDANKNIVTEGGGGEESTFFQEYNYKLKNVYDSFYTEQGKKMAKKRQKAAIDFYDVLLLEIHGG